ncbi:MULTISPECIES: MoaD/ThiS family protein [unclassified Leeuwenhoekiella]|uniref:MoaD/ThiS family protein n=1 Tax=unclassified Leeuwenhoekiella TaxID=2615029 RepID=UPI000C4A90BF|nr:MULTISPECIES: MoaD/ThiS family protein [unclassified Leeuwenhoekiella]MAW95212.1 molybdopterin synthase sulfur carrier subunit [Leeuwenhoekiella sp.]MBA81865.1 molybdopterin synthase sulfur carrier subunit [Leeuwenhoekiella sp.]|tara:strand:+ start:22251 stop:22490 length:240 start_codon:yes stop_codon:yes gene_type:complete
MEVTMKYFGQLVDVIGSHEEQKSIKVNTTDELLQQLSENYAISHIPFQLAVNDQLIGDEEAVKLNDGDVVALLPPYAGG